MRENELENGFDIDENEEKDVFEEAEPVFDKEDVVLEVHSGKDDEEGTDEIEDESDFEMKREDNDAYDDMEDGIGDEENIEEEGTTSYRKESDKKKTSVFSEICSFLLYIGAAVLVTFLILHFIGQRTVVNGPSMMNTLKNGDNIILDKISYRFHDPERFDIIVFPVANEEKNYIKRIIGLPGETVQVLNGFVYITDADGKFYELEESYGAEIMLDEAGNYLTTAPVKLGEDEYFVLGDNRNDSIDSRRIGPIPRDIIKGRAWIRIYPFDSMGKIQ